jgi:phosphatidylinositol alpha-mannosyltransferase
LRENRDDTQLIIGGNGVLRKSLEKLVIQNEIPDVTFLGFVPDDEKFKLLSEADIFCSPALYGESFGIVLLEAMASGTPIVAGNNSGYASVLTETGMIGLVSPKATDDFAKRLELLLYDEPSRQIWEKWAKRSIVKYDFKNIADEYEELYKKAIQNHA